MADPDIPPDAEPRLLVDGLSIQMPAIQPHYTVPPEGRNGKCPCGSGKKFKKCHEVPRGSGNGERPRQEKMTLEFPQPISIGNSDSAQIAVKIDPATKAIQVLAGGTSITPTQVEVERNYARDKGPKVTNTARVDGPSAHFDLERALRAYALCFGVDTNTRDLGGDRISVTGTCLFDPSQDPSKTTFIFPGPAFELRNVVASPEKLGWFWHIKAFMDSPRFDPLARYCVVVDSHLAEIEGINRRERDLLDGQKLPEQFELAYASADSGNATQNRLIKHADWCASRVFTFLENGQQFSELDRTPDAHADARRIWDIYGLVSTGAVKLV